MYNFFHNIKIEGIATAVPIHTTSCLDAADTPEKQKEIRKKIRLTGIKERHVVKGTMTAADLCYLAAKKVMEALHWDSHDIGYLIFVSQTSNYQLPSTAFYLQDKLKIGKQCFCFDINLGCSGYTAGLQVISSLMQNGKAGEKGLLLAGDTLSKYIDESDSATSLLFGDAGSATALICEEHHLLQCMNASDGSGFDKIMLPSKEDKLYMDGASVFEFTIGQVVDGIREFINHFHIEKERIDYYVFHQAQKFIINNIADLLELDPDKLLCSYENYGNTSVASIPLSLCANKDQIEKKESVHVLLSGFGVGLAWGGVYLEIDPKIIHDVILTEDE